MKMDPKNDPKKPKSHPRASGTVSLKMIKDRAIEIAAMNGRSASELKSTDYVAANHELTGQPAVAPVETVLDDVPESERWNPVPGSPGHQAKVTPSADEDEEGRSVNERLVEEGINAAENDEADQAAKETREKDE